MADTRTVHATQRLLNGQVAEVVRYDKAGRWYHEAAAVEAAPMWQVRGNLAIPASRTEITVSTAVGLALAAIYSEHGQWFPGRPGGRTLDSRVRNALKNRRKP